MVTQVKVPCQSVAVRFIADTRTDEFLNIGVILFCSARRYAGAKFLSSWSRISSAFPTADLVHLRRLKRLFEAACDQWVAEAPQPMLFGAIDNLRSLLGSVLAVDDDATIAFSSSISGVTSNPEASLAELFRLYVAKEDEDVVVEGRDDDMVWRETVRLMTPLAVQSLRRHTLRSAHYEQTFEQSWKNGMWNAAQALSFDMNDPQRIREKALLWSSKLRELRPAESDTVVHFLVGLPNEDRPKDVRKAARDAFDILSDSVSADDGRVLRESEASALVKKIEEDVSHSVENVTGSGRPPTS